MQLQHIGKIIDLTKGSITVSIENMTECNGCNARLLCNKDTDKGRMTVNVDDTSQYVIGETVKLLSVGASQELAIRVGIIYPCLILLAIAAILILLGAGQTVTASCSLVSVFIYYGTLYFVSRKVNNLFKWTVHKLN